MTRRQLPCATIHPDTHVATPAAWKPSAGRDAMSGAWDRYRAVVATLVPEAFPMIHPLVDLTPSSVDGPSRRLVMAADGLSMAKLVEGMGYQVHRDHALLIMTPAYGATTETSDGDLREQVAMDLGYVIERLYPVEAKGPIEPMIPWLTRLVGSIIAHGSPEKGSSSAISSRMLARHFAQAVHETFDSWNARAEFLTAYPSWPYLAETMARMAIQATVGVPSEPSMERIATQTREIMGNSLDTMGLSSVPQAA